MSLRVIGLDLGQKSDYSAAAVIEAQGTEYKITVPAVDAEYHVASDRQVTLVGPPVIFDCRFLRRWELGTAYPEIVTDTIEMVRRPPGALLAVDVGGVGLAVGDLFTLQEQEYVAVAITAGRQVNELPNGFTVPKADLVAAVQIALQSKRLTITRKLPEAATLIHELEVFDGRLTETGRETFAARGSEHDDTLLALCLACWTAEQAIRQSYNEALEEVQLAAANAAFDAHSISDYTKV